MWKVWGPTVMVGLPAYMLRRGRLVSWHEAVLGEHIPQTIPHTVDLRHTSPFTFIKSLRKLTTCEVGDDCYANPGIHGDGGESSLGSASAGNSIKLKRNRLVSQESWCGTSELAQARCRDCVRCCKVSTKDSRGGWGDYRASCYGVGTCRHW